MPIATIVQNPGVVWAFEFEFPVPGDADIAPMALGAGGWNRYHLGVGEDCLTATARDAFPGTVQAGGGSVCRVRGGEQVYVSMESVAGQNFRFPMGPLRFFLDTGNAAPIAAGAEMAPGSKAWWLRWLMRSPGNPTQNCGCVMMPHNDRNNVGWPGNAVGVNNRGGFGFVGDGAGQWVYRSYDRTGISLVRETVALPAHNLGDWNQFELFILNARPGIPATVQVWFNGVLIATRNWLGVLLEDYAANEWSFAPTFNDFNAAVTQFKQVLCRRGGFTREGVAI